MDKISARRSFLFTPADSLHKIGKIASSGADVVILDLEDAVAPNCKDAARQNVVKVLAEVDFGGVERLVRINGPNTPFFTADLEAVVCAKPDGVVVPKVETAVPLQHIHNTLTTIDPDAKIRLFALVETALALMNIKEIAQATSRLEGLIFGAEDLAADMGIKRTKGGQEIFYGRSLVATAAAAYNLQAIDTVYLDFFDQAGLKNDTAVAQQLGYRGKLAIHPAQVAVINTAFSPSAAEIAQAQELIAAYEAHLAQGRGVFVLNGQMVDMPIIRFAQRTLNRAKST